MAEEKNEVVAKKPSFWKGIKAEFKKIIWPDKTTVAKETGAVVFFGVVLGVLIAVIDSVIKYGLNLIL